MNDTIHDQRFKLLPSVDELLTAAVAEGIGTELGHTSRLANARFAVGELRQRIAKTTDTQPTGRSEMLREALELFERSCRDEDALRMRSVINATGVVIHTNLGRAPLSDAAANAVNDIAAGYSNLECDITTGKRGKRGAAAEALICQLNEAEAAIIVNNCAAAAFLVMSVFGSGGEVIVSRGELVEIGGDFRVPDVLERSGATLREVGTTNRTKISDYAKAVGPETKMLLRVHPSNYRIIGFTEMPTVAALAGLSKEKGLVFFEDAGSGAMVDLSEFGLAGEPLISRSISDGADIVSFSGDKLLGGPQCGIIVGRSDLIETIRRHPLYRALRVDKLAYAALEATLGSYARRTHFEEIPVLRMLTMTPEELEARTRRFADKLKTSLAQDTHLEIEVITGRSAIGGGSAPGVEPETTLLAITSKRNPPTELENQLRRADRPVIARIAEDRLLIDLRTVSSEDEQKLIGVLAGIAICETA